MRTAVADTSIAACHALGPKLGCQQAQIVAYLAKHCHRNWTRLELAEAMGMRLSSVCARCNELVASHVLAEVPARRCKSSGRAAHPVQLAPAQVEMFA